MNHKIQFTPQEWKDLVDNRLDGSSIDAKWLYYLARVPDLKQRYQRSWTYESDQALRFEIKSIYEDGKTNTVELRKRLKEIEDSPSSINLAENRHALSLRTLAVTLATVIVIGRMLDTLEPQNISRNRKESSLWAMEILRLARTAQKYRLGSLNMVSALSVAWFAVEETSLRDEILALLEEYASSFLVLAGTDWSTELEKMAQRLTLEGVPSSLDRRTPDLGKWAYLSIGTNE